MKLCKCGCGKPTTKIKKTINKLDKVKGDYNRFIFGHHNKGKPKLDSQKKKMSNTRKKWYKDNPEKVKAKSKKMSETKRREGTHAGKNNWNYGSKMFRGKSFIGKNEKHPNWKGDLVGYSGVHTWIKKNKPKSLYCEDCGEKKLLELANISSDYKRDFKDWKWVCRRCHMIEDGRIFNNLMKGGLKDRMAKVILKNAIKRKKGYLYYIDGEGSVMETPMARGRKKKAVKKVSKKTTKKPAKKKVTKKVTKKKKK